ncbi:hypothetical protein EDD21DRAFT_352944 [Dissophora ornata]|nr:hypothetical protein BGZ58_011140 [Dissophora ornata]KAI8602231.1 hypothetical protein EDD21DRAFT_352944 [Dissophora ornata]
MRPARFTANPYATRASSEVPSGVPEFEASIATSEITVVHATEQVPTPTADNVSTSPAEQALTPALAIEEAPTIQGIGITQELGVTQEQADEAIASLVRVRGIVSATAAICFRPRSLLNAEVSSSSRSSNSVSAPEQTPETLYGVADPSESASVGEAAHGKKRKQPQRQASSNSRANNNNNLRISVPNKRAKTTKAAPGRAKRGASSSTGRGGKGKAGGTSRKRKTSAAITRTMASSPIPGASISKSASRSKTQASLEMTLADQSVPPFSHTSDDSDTKSASRNSGSAGDGNIHQHIIQYSTHGQRYQQSAFRREYWASHYLDSRPTAHDRRNMTLEESEGMAAAALRGLNDSPRGQEAGHHLQQAHDERSASQPEQYHHHGQPYVGPKQFGYYHSEASLEHMRALGRDVGLSLRSAYLFGYSDGLDTARGVARHHQEPCEQQYGQPHEQHHGWPHGRHYGYPHVRQHGQVHEQSDEHQHGHTHERQYGYPPHDRQHGHPQAHRFGQPHEHHFGQLRGHQHEQQQTRYTLPPLSGLPVATWRQDPLADAIPESLTRKWQKLPPINNMHFSSRFQVDEFAHLGQSDNTQVSGLAECNRSGEYFSASRPASRSQLRMGNRRLPSLLPSMSVMPVRPIESMRSTAQTMEPEASGPSEQSVSAPTSPPPTAVASTVGPANELLDDSAAAQAPVQTGKCDSDIDAAIS